MHKTKTSVYFKIKHKLIKSTFIYVYKDVQGGGVQGRLPPSPQTKRLGRPCMYTFHFEAKDLINSCKYKITFLKHTKKQLFFDDYYHDQE